MGYYPKTIENVIVIKFPTAAAAALAFNVNPGLGDEVDRSLFILDCPLPLLPCLHSTLSNNR